MEPLIIYPAYGVCCETADQLLNNWKAGKDFRAVGRWYCSIRDITELKKCYSSITLVDVYTKVSIKI